MQDITCVISQYVENSSIVYVIEILRLCEGSYLLQEVHPDGRYTYIYADTATNPCIGTQLDQRRRRKPTTNPLLPLRPNRHPERDDR